MKLSSAPRNKAQYQVQWLIFAGDEINILSNFESHQPHTAGFQLKVINWAERRIKRRHKAPNLVINVRAIGIKRWLSPSISARCLDFNRYGMAIHTNKQLRPRARVMISFKGKYIVQSDVPGLVTECIEVEQGYRTSIRFSYALDSKHYSRKIDNALSRIESLYNPSNNPPTLPNCAS